MSSNPILRRLTIDEGILKLIAVVTMFIDHVGAVLIEYGILHTSAPLLFQRILSTPEGIKWYAIDMIFRTVGRISFPIFFFLLVEGFLHTRNIKKYLLRLAAFALISEIPFDLAAFGSWFCPSHQNIFFTLLTGLAVLAGLRKFQAKPFYQLLVCGAGCGFSFLIKSDYDIMGITLIASFYLLRKSRLYYPVCAILTVFMSTACLGAAVLALIPIRLCNGKRGRQLPKYFFYAFYPAHLLFLLTLRNLFIL